MKHSQKYIKNRGFLLIIISIISLIMLSNFLLSYKIIIKKNKRLNYLHNIYTNENEMDFLKTFTYDELYSINNLIYEKKYKNILGYFGKKDSSFIWYMDNNKISEKGFVITRMSLYLNGILKRAIYPNKKNVNFSTELKKALIFSTATKYQKNIVEIICEKKFVVDDEKIILLQPTIVLEYNYKNTNPYNPNKSYLKEVEASFD